MDDVKCWVTPAGNELLFSFSGISRPDLTQIKFFFSNFINPWSAVKIKSIKVNSYTTTDCSGPVESSRSISSLTFFPHQIPAEKVKIIPSTDTLGYSEPQNEVTFKITPTTTFSLDGNGKIAIRFPKWYNVLGGQSMMFD